MELSVISDPNSAAIRILFKAYLFLLPLTHWLAPTGWLPLPNVVLMLAALLCFLDGKLSIRLVSRDFIFLFLALLAVLTTLLNTDFLTAKSLNHLAALLFIVVLNYFIGGRVLFSSLGTEWFWPLLGGFLFSGILCVVEFTLVNAFHMPFPGYRPFGVEYDSTFIFGVRPRSTFSESGHFAFYLAVVVPVLLASALDRGRAGIAKVVLAVFGICAVLLFSTSLFLVMVIWMLIRAVDKKSYLRPWGVLGILLTVFSLVLFASWFLDLADTLVLHKFRTFSFDDRQEKFQAIVSLVADSGPLRVLFGHGMGSFEALRIPDSISCYANFVRDTGFLGLLLLLFVLLPYEVLDPGLPRRWRLCFVYVTIAMVFYLAAIPNYYFPHVALFLGLMASGKLAVRNELAV